MTISIRDYASSMADLGIPAGVPLLAHVSLSAIGEPLLDPQPLLSALTQTFPSLVMPAYTFKSEIMPPEQQNGLFTDLLNRQSIPFTPELSADRGLGITAETFRRLPETKRSQHPLLSFSAIGCDDCLAVQSPANPWGVIEKLILKNGWVLLLGFDQTANISLHYAAKLAGLALPTRYAATTAGMLACPEMPGCSRGFHKADAQLRDIQQEIYIGNATAKAYPMPKMINILKAYLQNHPEGLKCDRIACRWCRTNEKILEIAGDK